MIKKEKIAICGSRPCTGKEIHYMKVSDYIVKDVPRGTIQCPDCKHGLRWVSKRNEKHAAVVKRERKPRTKIYQMSGE